MLSALVLDNARFANVQIENGKLVSDGTRTLALGYALPGMQESLSLPEELKLTIPDHVTLRADVTDFALGSVYSLGAADLFGDYDESDPESLEKLLSSARDLSDGMAQLMEGAKELNEGLDSLMERSGDLQDGVNALSDGADQVSEGARSLSGGAKALSSGAAELQSGAGQLAQGTDSLRKGSGELAVGAAQLREGLETFDEKAIQAITRLVNEDGRELAERLKALAELGRTYRASYTGRSPQAEGELRFIYRSSSIG